MKSFLLLPLIIIFFIASAYAIRTLTIGGALARNPGFEFISPKPDKKIALMKPVNEVFSIKTGDESISLKPGNELLSLKNANLWLNSKPLTAAGLKGKIVLVQFWTYTCINWIRAYPYVRAWGDKYKNLGLVVVGVHTPEFVFEENIDNVRKAAKELNMNQPIAVDNERRIWDGFNNQFWPAIYLIDAKGKIRYQQFGEGDYEITEARIQELLMEAGRISISKDAVSVNPNGVELGADWKNLGSAENYLGHQRTENFVGDPDAKLNMRRIYKAPTTLSLNHWALTGEWTIQEDRIILNKANGIITYTFHSRDLHLVMGPSRPGSNIRFRVLIDGVPPGTAHGVDIDEQGYGILRDQRLYNLIRQPGQINDRLFTIEFFGSGAEAFSFTFG